MSLSQKISSERPDSEHVIKFSNNEEKKLQQKETICKRGKKTFIGISIGIFAIIVIGIVLYFFLKKVEPTCSTKDELCNITPIINSTNEEEDEDDQTESKGESNPNISPNNFPSAKELKKVLKSEFKINSDVGTLSQIFMKKKKFLKLKNTGLIDNTIINAIIDSYVMSEDSPEKSGISDYYKKKITTLITINSFCYASEGTDCELKKYIDLSENNKNNLRNIEQEINIEELTIPVCLIEHTDSNIILSISCPYNLEDNIKNLIKLAFKCIKPESIKGAVQNKTLADTTIETNEDKIYINSFSKLCEDEKNIDKTCERHKIIITDKDGNFISSNQKLKTETSSLINEYEYDFKDITSENSENLNTINFKNNLNILLNLLQKHMKKESFEKNNNLRILNTENIGYEGSIGYQSNSYFNTQYNSINITTSLIDNIIMEDKSRTASNIQINDNILELSSKEVKSNITKTIETFKIYSDAINRLATKLYTDINEALLEIINKINSEFTIIQNLIAFNDLSSIYDSTFAISGLKEFPYSIVTASKHLYTNLKNLNDDLPYSINKYKTKLKDNISSFLSNGHNLIDNIFNNLKELNKLLSSKKTKIVSIATFHELNSTNTSFVKIIERANEILDNYYIYEKDKIENLLNELFDKFTNKSSQPIENGQSYLDSISNRLENESVVINKGDENDIKCVLENLYNAKILENQIIYNVFENLKKNIILSNGYLVSENFIEQNKRLYLPIGENAINIANDLVNNNYIDENFNEIMKYFRQQFLIILKYIEKSKCENFSIRSIALSEAYFEDLESFFKNEKINIKKFIEKDNENFLNSINEKINSFLEENQNNLTKLIVNIESSLNKLNLDNMDNKYNEILNYSINNITYILDNIYDFSLKFLNDVKSTTHLTQTIINKMTDIFNRLNEIESYINHEFKNDLINKYKNVTNQFKKGLQSIKSNTIIKKYYEIKDLSFFKKHLDIYINQTFSTLNDYFSDKVFNTKYLNIINDFIKSSINKINILRTKLNELYSPISKLEYKSDSFFTIYFKKTIHDVCIFWFFSCLKREDFSIYLPKYVSSLKLNSFLSLNVNLKTYSNEFDSQYQKIYNNFSENIIAYNNIVENLGNELETIAYNYSQKKIDYMNSITEKSKLFIINQLGINILKSSYSYYKNELNKKLPTEANLILEQWKSIFNKVYKDIESNVDKFKYPIDEFNYLAMIYYEYYRQNISYSYFDSVVEQRKHDFNYTIKYHYNLFLSKVNKTYTYILNNLPSNEKPFDNILDNQVEQIKNSYNEIMNLAFESQEEIINLNKQLKTLKVSATNFFEVNSHSVDISYKIEEQLPPLMNNLNEISDKVRKFTSEESVVNSFFLENMENENIINELLSNLNKGTFIEFNFEEYQFLFEKIMEIDTVDLKNKISDFLTKSNEELKSIFENKRKNYKNQLKNEIISKLYSKDDLEKEINLLYSEGLNDLDDNSKNEILKYIDEIIEKIKEQLINEKSRLLNESVSYSNNYNKFNQRLNQYKNRIYNEFYSIIHSVVNNFYIDIKEKFYTNYTEKYLNILYESVKRENFSEYNFLNISISLKKAMDEDIEILISEYKNWTLKHINYLNDKKLQTLNKLFLFENLKIKINNKIDYLYETILLPTLNETAINNSGEEDISDYDFSETIINNIEFFFNIKINEAKAQIDKMKGNKSEIEDDWNIPDFYNVKREIFENMIKDFNQFSITYSSKEINDFNNVISININNNFKKILNNFIPSFGKDYFERILKYNEIQNIKSLYGNLKYSQGITLTYYMYLIYSYSISSLPEDLAVKILNLNYLDSLIKTKINEVLTLLNSKFEEFLKLTKNKSIEKYINYIMNDFTLKNDFKRNVINLVYPLIENKRYIFENEYTNMMNIYIKNPFIEQYTKILKESTEDLIDFTNDNKEMFKLEMKEVSLVFDKNEVLNNIENKLNETLNSIEEYHAFLNKGKISEDIELFLDNYAVNNILPLHQEIKDIMDDKTPNLMFENLDKNSGNFIKAYSSENIESKLDGIYILFKDQYFENITESLKKYGTIDEIYLTNLEREIINISNRKYRILEEIQEGFIDLKLENTFKSLKASSQSAKQEIQTLDLFSNFENKINEYKNNINEQYEISKSLIERQIYSKEVNLELVKSLNELKNLSFSYYDKIKIKYDKIKDYIKDSILRIDEQLEESYNITEYVINFKYQEIKDNFNQINDTTENSEKFETYRLREYDIDGEDSAYEVEINMNNMIKKNEFLFDIIFDDGKYKLIGQTINGNKPQSLNITFSSKQYKCKTNIKEMILDLNNITSKIDLEYDSSSLNTLIAKNYNFSEYFVSVRYFNETEESFKINFGVPMGNSRCIKRLIHPENEKNIDKIPAKSGHDIKSF